MISSTSPVTSSSTRMMAAAVKDLQMTEGRGLRRRGSVVRYVSLACLVPPISVKALHTAAAPALSNRASATEPRQHSSTATACRVSPMELPLGGPALRHYTQSRPRPHRQKLNYRPTRPQETIIECENEDFELMGRVDEGVEEFFTKKVLPTETLKKENEEEEETITVHEVAPASAVPCPPPTKTLRRKLGDFFTLKKRRGLKSETSQEGRPKKASIADFIRPLREVARGEKDKDKVKEHDKENEKEKGKDSTDTGEADQGISISDAPPMRGEAVPPRRALREGKSQSLILLSGSASGTTRNKKQLDGQNSFEQKLHLMLQRIGVSKPQSGEAQNQEGEMKKAESEGTIIDSKPEPPSTKPRTMSASSDTRHQLRSSVSAHESAGKPPLLPKPVIRPAPPTTTSGRNTPDNELGQIVEGEPNAPTIESAEAAQAVSATSTSTVATISDTAPDSATVLPSSTVIPTDTVICTDSGESTAEATAPANVTEQDSTVMPEASATTTAEPLSPTIEEALTSTTTPATPSPEPNTLNLIGTSSSTVTTPSSTTLETVSVPSDANTTPTTKDMSAKLKLPEPNGTVTNATVDTAAPASTSISYIPADLSDNVVTTARDEMASCTFSTSQSDTTTVSIDNKTTSEAPNLSESLITVTSVISSDTTVVTSFSSTTATSCALLDKNSSICTAAISETTASTTCTSSLSTSSHTSTDSQDPTPVTSVTCNTTPMTDTSQTTTLSTASSQLMANSELPVSTAFSPVIADVLANEDQNVTSDHLTMNEPSDTQLGQDHELQTSPPNTSMMDCTVKGTAEEALEVVQNTEVSVTAKSKSPSDSETESQKKTEEPTLTSCEVIMEEQEEKPKEEQGKTNDVAVAKTEASKGTSDELSKDEVINVDQKQQETMSSDEK